MSQSPLGHDPSRPGVFDAPGQPDLIPSDGATVPEQSTAPRAGTTYTTETYQTEQPSGSGSKVDTAKGEARQVAGTAVDSGKEVAQTAKDEAKNVVAETKQQAASLLDTVRTEAGQQVGTQQNRIADALHGLSKELGSMASSSEESGPLTDLAHQASRKGGEVAHWLQEREPADVLEAVRSYARRRPATFLALCGLAGVVAGRLTRSTVATRTSLDSKDGSSPSELPERGSNYAVQPVPAPMSTGVYGGNVESTATPYDTEPTVPGGGYVGTTRPLTDPNGDLTR